MMWDGKGKIVEIVLSDNERTLWVNIDGVCALRCQGIEICEIELPQTGMTIRKIGRVDSINLGEA